MYKPPVTIILIQAPISSLTVVVCLINMGPTTQQVKFLNSYVDLLQVAKKAQAATKIFTISTICHSVISSNLFYTNAKTN